MKKRSIALLLAVVLLVVCAVGGTIAWLTASSGSVTNTFTVGNVKVELKETTDTFKMVPGFDIAKDPKAKVLSGSEECWLFVKLDESSNLDDFITYTVADGWYAVTGADGVYAREVTTANIGTAYSVLAGDKVSVKDTVTNEDMATLTAQTYPKLTVTAYAVQLYKSEGVKFTAAEAWAKI